MGTYEPYQAITFKPIIRRIGSFVIILIPMIQYQYSFHWYIYQNLCCFEKGEDMFYWFMLLISIITEVTGTISIKFAGDDAGPFDYLLLFSLVASSYYFLSKAIQGIPMGLAYAIWEGLGLIIMLTFGYLFFNERIYKEKFLACSIIIIGMLLLHKGRIKPSQKGE